MFSEDIGDLPPTDVGKGNIVDLLELVRAFSTVDPLDTGSIREQFADLVNSYIDLPQAVELYRRFAAEAQGVLAAYPRVRALLP